VLLSDEAIALVRQLRPGSIETARQERFVREYARELWRRVLFCLPRPPMVDAASAGRRA